MTQLVLVGTSHHLAPVELRERLSFGAEAGGEIAARVAAEAGEAVALSTCNRTSLYVAHADGEMARRRALEELAAISKLPAAALEPSLHVLGDREAAHHLFRVASGLDSLVPGEAQILGQVRSAYEASCRMGAVGPVLHRLFRQALHAGKRVRSETAIGANPTSVSSAAAELAASVFGELSGRSVLVLGAGKVGELTVSNLISRGASDVRVLSRSRSRALELAERVGGAGFAWDDLDRQLAEIDIVVSSTGAEPIVLTAAQVERATRRRRGQPVFFIDIAVPRDLDPAINDLEGCYLYDIDDLERVVADSVAGRREEAVRAEEIAAEEADSFHSWRLSLDVVPAIASLRALAEDIRLAELERAKGRLASLSEKELQAVESLTSQIVAKLLHVPTIRMKQAAAAADAVVYAETVRHLFGLGEEKR
jgi:glutamyl-tRNA reductase